MACGSSAVGRQARLMGGGCCVPATPHLSISPLPSMTDSKISLKPLQPTLYELAEDGHSLNFFFAQCGACGGLSFPANAPGCMHCGSPLSEAQRVTRPGGGELLEFVTLHVPLLPGMAAPSIAGDIRIDSRANHWERYRHCARHRRRRCDGCGRRNGAETRHDGSRHRRNEARRRCLRLPLCARE